MALELELEGEHVRLIRAVERVLDARTRAARPARCRSTSTARSRRSAPTSASPTSSGNAIFLISRLPGLIAHAHEERTRQAPMRQIDPKDHDYDGARDRRFQKGGNERTPIRSRSGLHVRRRPDAGRRCSAARAGAVRSHPAAADDGAAHATGGTRERTPPHRLSRPRSPSGRHVDDRSRRARGAVRRQRNPARPQAPMDPGHRPGGAARRHTRNRACATSPTRCCRAPTAGCSTAKTHSVSFRRWRSTTSAT